MEISYKDINYNNKYTTIIKENEITVIPGTTIDKIHTSATGTLKTGGSIQVGEKEYTVIMIGDINGDGEIKATDYMKLKNYIIGTATLTTKEKLAADANQDGAIKASDYMKIKNHIIGTQMISF